MNVYNYHPYTLVYTGLSEADESPLEPGVFLIPAYATTEEPLPEKSGFNIVYQNNTWTYQPVLDPAEGTEKANAQKLIELELLAKSGLFNSDWVLQPDVLIANTDEWLQYRAKLRSIAVNPTLDAVIPVKPEVIWS